MPFPLALIGAALAGGSALAGGLANRSRKPGSFQQVPNKSPQQIGAQNQALQMALSGLQNPTAGFQPIADQETKRFNEQTIPSLAERFTSMGNGQRSSAFQGALGNAGADLGGQLAALKAQYGLQNQGQLQQLLGIGLQPQFDTAYSQPTDTFASGALSGLSSGLGSLSSAYGLGALGGQPQQPGLGMLQAPQQRTASQDVAALQSPQAGQAGLGQGGGNQGQNNFENFLRQYLSGMK
jgi:hypothetical protein